MWLYVLVSWFQTLCYLHAYAVEPNSDNMASSYTLHVEKYPNYSILCSLIPCVGHFLARSVQIVDTNDSWSKIFT